MPNAFASITYTPNYPATVAECLVDGKKYHPDALRALKAYRREKPWRGTEAEKIEKLARVHAKLCEVYGLRARLTFAPGSDCYMPGTDTIALSKVSVVTYLHEFAHARGADEREAVTWSVNLFRRIFPRSYGNCRHERHMLAPAPAPRRTRRTRRNPEAEVAAIEASQS